MEVSTLLELISYNPCTGALTWKARPESMFSASCHMLRWNKRYAGTPALQARHVEGYRHGSICGQHVLAHRAAWAIATGRWPSDQIDHINGDRADNRLSTLREASPSVNRRNAARHRRNKSGVNGVHLRKSDGRYLANILVDGRTKHLGLFDTLAEAAAARSAAERLLGYHPSHGKRDPFTTSGASAFGAEHGVVFHDKQSEAA